MIVKLPEGIYIYLFICINYDVFLFHGRPLKVSGASCHRAVAAVHRGRVDSSTSLGHSALGVYESMSNTYMCLIKTICFL